MVTVQGKGNIKATVIADSISENGNRITTFELEYPRFIHAEFMTHRLFSRNAASSRAIPVNKMIGQVESCPAIPIHWGKNQPGMQAKEELGSLHKTSAKMAWDMAAYKAVTQSNRLNNLGVHKQIVNRLLEPFQMIKVVCTATEYDNFFYLRNHSDAQPEIHELAGVMYDAIGKSVPELLKPGEWHLPYVDKVKYEVDYGDGISGLPNDHVKIISIEDALKLSSSCCAQVSYRLLDNSLEKAIDIYNKLVESKPVHASPFEHQATPMECPTELIDIGATHVDVYSNTWSGNLKGWIQHRQLIPYNTCWDYDPCE